VTIDITERSHFCGEQNFYVSARLAVESRFAFISAVKVSICAFRETLFGANQSVCFHLTYFASSLGSSRAESFYAFFIPISLPLPPLFLHSRRNRFTSRVHLSTSHIVQRVGNLQVQRILRRVVLQEKQYIHRPRALLDEKLLPFRLDSQRPRGVQARVVCLSILISDTAGRAVNREGKARQDPLQRRSQFADRMGV
jgi:hypothetical protein